MSTKPDLSPSELHQSCLEIQAGWSPDERLKRLRADLRPMVKAADGRLVTMAAADYGHHERRGSEP